MIRPFRGAQAIAATGTAQPVFGSSVTTAFVPPPDPFSGNLNPGSNETQVTIIVGSTTGFISGDNVLVGPSAAFGADGTSTALADWGTVKSVVDGTHVIVQGLKKSHGAGEFFVLDQPAGNVHIRPATNAAVLNLGTAATTSATDSSLIEQFPITAAGAAPAVVFDAESIGATQPFQTSEFWIEGTAADTFIARFTTV